MVKQNPSMNFNRNTNQYSSRSYHTGPINSIQTYPSKRNRVETTQPKGCCGSRKVASVPSHPVIVHQSFKPPQPSPSRQTAHERTHLRLDPPDPFYFRSGRVQKNAHRSRKTYESKYTKTQMNSTRSTGQPQLTDRSRNYQAPPPPPPARQQQPPPLPRAPQTATKKNSCCTIL